MFVSVYLCPSMCFCKHILGHVSADSPCEDPCNTFIASRERLTKESKEKKQETRRALGQHDVSRWRCPEPARCVK